MRNKILSATLAFVTLVGLVPLTATTAEASEDDEIVEITTLATCNYDYANEVVELVNEERAAAGLNTLVNDKRLTEWAMQRAAEQAFSFGHVRPDGTSAGTVLDREEFGYPNYLSSGENAAMGQTSPTQVMNSWMNSAGHKATLMRDEFTAVGVGCVRIGGYMYWIQIFAGPTRGGSGADYKIIESTYSGTKEQTFTISTYTSNLIYFGVGYEGTSDSFVVGSQRKYCLYVKGDGMSKAPAFAYVVPVDVSDVKDESTGEVIATTSVAADGRVTITATAVGTGYLYLYPYEGASPQIVELVIFAGYTVTFDSNGGSSVSPQTVAHNSAATEPTAPTKKGYVFDGWYVIVIQCDEERDDWNQINVTYDFSTAVTKDITLYASWKADTASATTTAAAETTTAAPETTTTKSEETTAAPTEAVTEETTEEPDEEAAAPEEETTAQDFDLETSSELDEEAAAPDEETTGITNEETTEVPSDETTDGATDGVTEATETETTETMTNTSDGIVSDDENNSDSDNASLKNDNNASDKNGSNAWIVVLVVVLLIAAAGVTVYVVLRKNKSGETTDIENSAETAEDNPEAEETNGESDDSTGGDGDK